MFRLNLIGTLGLPYKHYCLNSTFEGKTWNRITSFSVKGTGEYQAVTLSELALCYHNVNHSFKLQQHRMQHKIMSSHVQRFQTGKQINPRRNKSEGLVTYVLSPSSVTDFLGNLWLACLLCYKVSHIVSL